MWFTELRDNLIKFETFSNQKLRPFTTITTNTKLRILKKTGPIVAILLVGIKRVK
jgi:hypothetical protein